MNVDPLRKQQTLSMKMQTVMGMEEIKMQVIKACLMMMPRCPFLILRAKVLLVQFAGNPFNRKSRRFKCWSVDMHGTIGAWRTHGALGGTTGDGVPTAVMFAPQRSRFSKPMRLLFTRGKEVVDSRKPPRLRSSCEPKPDER